MKRTLLYLSPVLVLGSFGTLFRSFPISWFLWVVPLVAIIVGTSTWFAFRNRWSAILACILTLSSGIALCFDAILILGAGFFMTLGGAARDEMDRGFVDLILLLILGGLNIVYGIIAWRTGTRKVQTQNKP